MLFGDFVRSPYGHARVKSINKEAAIELPGVQAVLTAEDLKPLKLHWIPTLAGDVQAVLADGKVLFQGQEVAFVVAEDRYIAADAVDLVEVDYEELPALVDPARSMAADAPVLRDDLKDKTSGAHGPRKHPNHVFTWEVGDAAGTIARHMAVLGKDGASCRPAAAKVAPDGDGVVVRIPWFCAGIADPLRYRSTVLTDVSPDARQAVLIGASPDAAQDLLDASRTETMLTAAPPSLLQVIGRYTEAGIEHIFLGYDHIAFLAAVVLWARRLWPVVKVVTAFTIAHSITLSLAALDIVRIPSSIIEPAIAASIVYVAAENFLSRDIDRRWRDTFCFGLIHGFGFASALQEFGLPRSALVPALASFNIGVEIG